MIQDLNSDYAIALVYDWYLRFGYVAKNMKAVPVTLYMNSSFTAAQDKIYVGYTKGIAMVANMDGGASNETCISGVDVPMIFTSLLSIAANFFFIGFEVSAQVYNYNAFIVDSSSPTGWSNVVGAPLPVPVLRPGGWIISGAFATTAPIFMHPTQMQYNLQVVIYDDSAGLNTPTVYIADPRNNFAISPLNAPLGDGANVYFYR